MHGGPKQAMLGVFVLCALLVQACIVLVFPKNSAPREAAHIISPVSDAEHLPPNNGRSEVEDQPTVEWFEEAFGIKIKTAVRSFQMGPISGDAAEDDMAIPFLRMVMNELRRYPRELFVQLQLNEIVICTNLANRRAPCAGVARTDVSVVYLASDRFGDQLYSVRKTLHHELFHIIDAQDDDTLPVDPLWKNYNHQEFRYGIIEAEIKATPSESMLTERYPGFISSYSRKSIAEDKAEIFEHLMIDPQYVEKRCEEDFILRCKVLQLKRRMAEISPVFNSAFWDSVSQSN